jgi:phosphoribosylaminoimidazolecarboxamide formyltransferase/IMP cyclohydrolase
MPIALLSVSDKKSIVELAQSLVSRGFTLVSTGGTARALTAAGIAVEAVSDVTRFPEMMDGRVKTLHPAIHAGILARRDRTDDMAALEAHQIAPIDVVVVNLYPFEKTASTSGVSFDALVEEIDIGGPSLIRAAAKNFRHTLVVVDPDDYSRLLTELDRGPSLAFRFELARKAFASTAEFDATVAATLNQFDVSDDAFIRNAAAGEATTFDLALRKVQPLRYGENPHQQATLYRVSRARGRSRPAWGFGSSTLLQGKELSFTNLLDLDAAARLVQEFDVPAAVVVKHMNPCGVALGSTIAEAYERARDADSLSAFGGIVALNRAMDADTARAIASTKIDCVVVPAVAGEAREIVKRKTAMRVVLADFAEAATDPLELRSILGGVLVQARDVAGESSAAWSIDALPGGFQVVSRRLPEAGEWKALRFAWQVCAHVKSNAVVFAGRDRTLAIGAGQMSRVDAARVAIMMARSQSLAGSVAATDGFFPFRDGVDAVAAAGATAVIHPGGSVKDQEVIAAADELGLAMVFTGRRHFRH